MQDAGYHKLDKVYMLKGCVNAGENYANPSIIHKIPNQPLTHSPVRQLAPRRATLKERPRGETVKNPASCVNSN